MPRAAIFRASLAGSNSIAMTLPWYGIAVAWSTRIDGKTGSRPRRRMASGVTSVEPTTGKHGQVVGAPIPAACAGRACRTYSGQTRSGRVAVNVCEARLGHYTVLRPVGRLDNGRSAAFQARPGGGPTTRTAPNNP